MTDHNGRSKSVPGVPTLADREAHQPTVRSVSVPGSQYAPVGEWKSQRPLADKAPAAGLALVDYVNRGLKEQGAPREYRDAFVNRALSGTYDELVNTCMEYTEEDSWNEDDQD